MFYSVCYYFNLLLTDSTCCYSYYCYWRMSNKEFNVLILSFIWKQYKLLKKSMVDTESCISFINGLIPWSMFRTTMAFYIPPLICSVVANWIWSLLFHQFLLWPCIFEPGISSKPCALLLWYRFIIFLFFHYQFKCRECRIHGGIGARGRQFWLAF